MPKKIIGLDAGAGGIKIVEIERSLRGFAFTRATSETGDSSNGEFGKMIESALGDNRKEREDEVWTSIPLRDVTSRLVSVPFTAESKIEKVIPFELESSGPFAAEEMVIDHHPFEKTKGNSKLLAAGVRREAVATRIEFLGKAGLNPRAIVPEGFAFRSLIHSLPVKPEGPYAFLDMGAKHSLLVAGLKEKTAASRSIPIGGDSLTEVIATRRSISLEAADRVKLGGSMQENEAVEAMRQAYSPLAIQIKNALRFLESEEGLPTGKIFLVGGASKSAGIDRLLTELIGVPCERFDIKSAAGGNDIGIEYAHALALALEEMNPVRGINFRKEEFAYKSEHAALGEKAIFPAVLLFFILLFLSLNVMVRNTQKERELSQTKARLANIVDTVFPGEGISPAQAISTMKEKTERIKKLEESLGKLSGVSPLQVLTAISTLLPPDLNVDMEQLDIKQETVTLKGIITQHSDMDIIIEKLKGFEPFKKYDPPELRPKVGSSGIEFTLRFLLDEKKEEEQP